MARYYFKVVPIRMYEEDMRRSKVAVQKLRTPGSTMTREVWREVLDAQLTQSTEKTAS